MIMVMTESRLWARGWRRLGSAVLLLGRIFAVFVVITAIYLLSVGPAFKLVWSHPRLGRAFEVFYYPVIRMCYRASPLERFYVWYLSGVWRIPMMRD